jgi:hypothetical protein
VPSLWLRWPARPPIHLTPVTTDVAVAEHWFHQFEGIGWTG